MGLAARLGGEAVIGRIVDGLYDRLERDPELTRLFGSRRADERRNLTFFFIEVLGGPPRYREHALGDVGLQRRHEHKVIEVAEAEASCELYGILKRPDEKFVTERAYDNPKFVEDIVRDIATRLNADDRIRSYVVEAENFESIHNHSAYARIARDKDEKPA